MPLTTHRTEHGPSALALIVLSVATTLPARAVPNRQIDSNLQSIITTVRAEKSPRARLDAAGRLPQLTVKARPGSVSDTTVRELIGLLDDPDDAIRLDAAATLGNLRAKAAIPKLLALLPAADCLEGTLTSARVIRYALEKMKVKPPPAPSYSECQNRK